MPPIVRRVDQFSGATSEASSFCHSAASEVDRLRDANAELEIRNAELQVENDALRDRIRTLAAALIRK